MLQLQCEVQKLAQSTAARERRVCRQDGFKLAKPEAATQDAEAPAQLTLQLDSAPLISRMRRELQQQAGDQTFLALITGGLGRQLTNTCLLCDSWIASTTKIAFHSTKKHRTEWDSDKASKWNDTTKMYVLTWLSSCPACAVKVESVPRHIQQCPVIQQLQLFFFLHPQAPISRSHSSLPQTQISLSQQTHATVEQPPAMASSQAPAMSSPTTPLESLTQVTLLSSKASQKTHENQALQPRQSHLQRWFKKGRASSATPSSAVIETPVLHSQNVSPSMRSSAELSVPQLTNPHNLCYAISVLQMISAVRNDASVDWSNLQQRRLVQTMAPGGDG